ncbi:hypothetical protein HDU83_006627 [Entophlyctis luteolus]|nr:hypothetical protein HDU83_006627 [Entophlyctis luteolus]KAJ3379912.1 hypothetical protein HDU84_006323 [Entophlyctis sp. JEL0112]
MSGYPPPIPPSVSVSSKISPGKPVTASTSLEFGKKEYNSMVKYLDDIISWRDYPTEKENKCLCQKQSFSPSAVHTCPFHTPDAVNRSFDRVRTQSIWQIEMVYEQPLLCFDVSELKFHTVNVLNGFRTYSCYKFIAISHLWPKPFDDGQERMDSQLVDVPSSFHANTQYKYSREILQFNSKDDGWVKRKVYAVIDAVKQVFGHEKILVWLDLVSVDQKDPFAIRDATYAMSIAYHIADHTLVLLDEGDESAQRWLERRWTLQELELAHDIKFITAKNTVVDMPPSCIEERKMMGKHNLFTALRASVRRKSRFDQDLVYAVRGLVPALFALPVVYDIDVYTLILRAATVCAKRGDYSILGAGGSKIPAGSLIKDFWSAEVEESPTEGPQFNVAPLANLTGCGLIFERQRTSKLTEEQVRELTRERQKRVKDFVDVDLSQDGGLKASQQFRQFQAYVRDEYGATNITISCRNALAAIAKGIADVHDWEHCESFDTNVQEVCESMLDVLGYSDAKVRLTALLKLLVLADPKHPLAVDHKRTQYVTWVLKSDVTKYEFMQKGMEFLKALLNAPKDLECNSVMVMRGEKDNAALRFVKLEQHSGEDWLVLSESAGVSYADTAAIVTYDKSKDKETRVRTQRGVAMLLKATKTHPLDSSQNLYDVFGLNIKKLLQFLKKEGAGQKEPVVIA